MYTFDQLRDTGDLQERYTIQKREFENRVNQLAVEYDTLIEHIPVDLSECCSVEEQPEPGVIHVTLLLHEGFELPPIVTQRIKEVFIEMFPEGKFI